LANAENKEDEKNITKYWANNKLDRLSADNQNSDSRNIFSSHPPFNFIIKYGTQEGSVTTQGRNQGTNSENNFDVLDRIMATDYNERLVQKNNSTAMNIVLQSVQLMNMGTTYSAGGQPLLENYQFFARDMYISEGGTIQMPADNEQTAETDSSGSQSTQSNRTSEAPTEELIAEYHEQFLKALNDLRALLPR
jgi:hypothetical protein